MSTDCISSQHIAFSEASGLAGHVQPEEQIFVLTSAQLREIISEAVARAQEPLVDRLEATEARLQDLQARINALEERGVGPGEGGEDAGTRVSSPAEAPAGAPAGAQGSHISTIQVVQDLQAENHALKRELEALQETTARERAFDRQRIAKLEHKEPQPLQKDRGEILRALIAANGGKMLAKEARQKMRISKSSFSQLLATMKDELGIKGYHQDKRNLVLFIK